MSVMIPLLLIMVVLILIGRDAAIAAGGPYLNSAHGNTSYGVDRVGLYTPTDFGYPMGHCAHCHEQHASICGSEPPPASGSPTAYLIFASGTSQANSFCFRCHRSSTDQQGGMPAQYNYSRMAGGDTTITCPDDIKESFKFVDTAGVPQSNCSSSVGSSHFLVDIKTFLQSKWGWGATVNPCSACHNPHRAKRDPHDTTSGRTDGSGNLIVSAVSRPSAHADLTTWELWGDSAGERMSDYTTDYQAPYRKGFTDKYEPDGSTIYQDGRNLADYVSLCTDCHNSSNTIFSTVLGRNLKTIDWATEVHGNGNADTYITVDAPYTAGSGALGYVLSCLDCHEPHGSPNAFLIREEVNGEAVGVGTITTFSTTDWHLLCDRCHKDDYELTTSCQEDHYYNIHHSTTYGGDPYYTSGSCNSCHGGSGGGSDGCSADRTKKVCTDCHFHGSTHSGHTTF